MSPLEIPNIKIAEPDDLLCSCDTDNLVLCRLSTRWALIASRFVTARSRSPDGSEWSGAVLRTAGVHHGDGASLGVGVEVTDREKD